MTLGPALLLLVLLDREPGRLGRAFVVFGRVPLFYYVAHLYLAHAASRAYNWIAYGEPYSVLQGQFRGSAPEGYGMVPLPGIYVAWLAIVVALYPLCRWYAGVKQRSRSPLLSYL